MAKKYLDLDGLSRVWAKIKPFIPTKTSDLTNDSGFLTADITEDVTTQNKMIFNSADNTSYKNAYIQAITGDANGSVLLVKPGGTLIAGGGEYALNRWGVGDITTSNEKAYFGSDSLLYIETNGNTIANRKTWEFGINGNLTTPIGGLINGVDITNLNPKIIEDSVNTLSPVPSIPTGTSWNNVMSFDLTPGIWLLEFTGRFASNATGYRGISISTTSGGSAQTYLLQDLRRAVSGSYTFVKLCSTYIATGNMTRYLNAIQNSGNALNMNLQYKLTLLRKDD